MLPIAIRLGSRAEENGALNKAVFIRQQSTDSAWRFALLGAAASYSQVGVGILHIYAYHVSGANFQWNFYNSLDSSHRLHNALKPFTKYTAQLSTHVLTNDMPLAGFPFHNNGTIHLFWPILAGWERLAIKFPYYKLLPSVYLADQGVFKEDFSIDDEWDLFPLAKFQVACEEAATRFVGKLVDFYYTTNQKVVHDVQLQAFVTAMQDPQRGNVRVTPSGSVSTQDELKHFLTVYMFGTIAHGSARMRQYIFQGTMVPNFIASFMDPELMMSGDMVDYSLQQMLRAMPDSTVLRDMGRFGAIFQATAPLESAFPNGVVDMEALPFTCGPLNDMWLDVLASMKEIFARGYYYKAPENEIASWPLNQEA